MALLRDVGVREIGPCVLRLHLLVVAKRVTLHLLTIVLRTVVRVNIDKV